MMVRMKNSEIVMAPSVYIRYRHPILFDLEQHSAPGAEFRHDGSGLESAKFGVHECAGMYAYASAEQMSTPSGWKIDSKARRNRLF